MQKHDSVIPLDCHADCVERCVDVDWSSETTCTGMASLEIWGGSRGDLEEV